MRTLIMLLSVAILFGACNSGNELEKKKNELAQYNARMDELRNKIAELEKEIALLDTSEAYVKPKLVNIQAIRSTPFAHFIDVQAVIDSEENIMVNAASPGLVTKVYVKEGDMVSAGMLLAELENRVILQSIAELETSLDLAKTTYEKQKRLWDQKIGSEIQYLQAKTQFESLSKTKSTLQAQLDLTRIKSPIAGMVDEVNIKIGETAAPGFGVFRVVNNNKMKAVARVADAHLGRIKKGDPVKLVLRELKDTITTSVSFVSKSVNPMSRTFIVEANLPSGRSELRPNMLATISVNDEIYNEALVVPSNTIQKDANGNNYVLVATNRGDKLFALKKVVESGASYAGQTVIKSGLEEGDMLITFGYQDIVDGQLIATN
ncbi:MAG: efflux RND transporter periplasmic adaptor subunit [Flavobacteriales bacterium]